MPNTDGLPGVDELGRMLQTAASGLEAFPAPPMVGPPTHLGPGDINQAARDVNIYQTAPQAKSIPRQLPHDISLFTGRDAELAALDAVLSQHEVAPPAAPAVLAVVGTAGVGKTALAVHWATTVRDRFPDGNLYIDMHGYHSSLSISPEAALDGFLRDLAPSEVLPSELEALAALYRSKVSERRILIVLDNVSDGGTVRQLLPGSPGCMVLITSRSNLSGLGVRDGVKRIALDPLPPRDAGALLRKIIGPERADQEADAVDELARLSAYLPLTLRISAGRAAVHVGRPLSQLARDLSNERRLDLLSTPDHDESTAVRSVFSWSLKDLSGAEVQMFRLLGLHAGPDISALSAAALAGTPPHEARQLLEVLAEVHLLKDDAGRYRFHDLLALYALERAHQDETAQAQRDAVRRELLWYLHTADAAERLLSTRSQRVELPPVDLSSPPLDFATSDEALAWCEAERVNLVAATDQAVKVGEYDIAWKLPNTLWGFLYLRKYWEDWIKTHHAALAAAAKLNDLQAQAWTLGSLAMAYRYLRRSDEAIEHLEQAIDICRRTGWRWGEAVGLTILGAVYYDLRRKDHGSFADAIAVLDKARSIFVEIDDRWGDAFALNNLGGIYRYCGQLDKATDCLHEALAIRRAIGDHDGEGDTLTEIGDACTALRRFDEALEYFGQALEIRRRTRNQQGEAYTLKGLGLAQSEMGNLPLARRSWRDALAIFEEFGNPHANDLRALLHESFGAESGSSPGDPDVV